MRLNSIRLFDPSKEVVVAKDQRLPVYDGSALLNVKPANTKILFTSDNSEYVIWDEDYQVAEFSHGLHCIPHVSFWDSTGDQVFPNISMTDGTSFLADFGQPVTIPSNAPWTCVIDYGSEYGDNEVIADEMASNLAQSRANAAAAEAAREDAIAAKNQAQAAASAAAQSYTDTSALVSLVGQYQMPNIVPYMQYATDIHCVYDDESVSPQVKFYWKDPAPYNATFGDVHTWKSTILVVSETHMPASPTDGTVLIENVQYNSHSTEETCVTSPLTHGVLYYKFFTKLYNDTVSTAANSPGAQFVHIIITSLSDFMDVLRDGNITALSSMYPVGSVMPFVTHNTFTNLYWRVAHYNYTGNYSTVSQYLNDNSKMNNCILVPGVVVSNSSGNRIVVPYDLIEKTSALSQDTEFVSGKTYYTTNQCTTAYDPNNASPGDTPSSLGLYEKGRVVASNGYGVYRYSFIRQYLNADAASGWYVPNSIFEPTTHSFATNNAGFLYGFPSDVKQYLHSCRNRYKTYTNTWDVGVEDTVFLPSKPMLYISTESYTQETLDYFKAMTSADQRIMRDVNGVACYAWTGSQENVSTNPSSLANTNVDGTWSNAGKLEGGSQQKDTALPMLCLA